MPVNLDKPARWKADIAPFFFVAISMPDILVMRRRKELIGFGSIALMTWPFLGYDYDRDT